MLTIAGGVILGAIGFCALAFGGLILIVFVGAMIHEHRGDAQVIREGIVAVLCVIGLLFLYGVN